MMTVVFSSGTAVISDWLDNQSILAIVTITVKSQLKLLQFGVQQWFKIVAL
jgi:hypothetical protein